MFRPVDPVLMPAFQRAARTSPAAENGVAGASLASAVWAFWKSLNERLVIERVP